MRKAVLFLVSILVSAFLLWGCHGDGGSNDPETTPPDTLKIENIVVTGLLENAGDGAPIQSAGLKAALGGNTVTVTGEDANKVFNGTGESLYNIATETAGPIPVQGGAFTFYVRAMNNELPLIFRIVAKVDGFVTSSQVVTIQDVPDGIEAFPVSIKLVKSQPTAQEKADLIQNVGVAVESNTSGSSDASGSVSAPITIVSAPVPTSLDSQNTGDGQVEVQIPQGTVITNSAGAALTGQLTATVTYHNPIGSQSLQTFPGGLEVDEDENGEPLPEGERAAFVSGGFTSVQVSDEQGNLAKDFSDPIFIKILMPAGIVNPETGAAIASGDTVPLWSYDTDSGKWTVLKNKSGEVIWGVVGDSDADGVVNDPAKDAAGNFYVSFRSDHLSYFNVDWWLGGENLCTAKIDLVDAGSGAIINNLNFNILLNRSTGGWNRAYDATNQTGTLTIARVPGNVPIKVTAALSGGVVGEEVFANLCANGLKLPVTLPAQEELTPVTVKVQEECTSFKYPNGNTAPKPTTTPGPRLISSTPVYYRIANSNYWNYGGITKANGVASVPGLVVGNDYEIAVFDRRSGSYVFEPVTVTAQKSVTITLGMVCTVPPPTTGGTGGTGSGQ